MIGKKINELATKLDPISSDLTIIGDPSTGVSKKVTLAQIASLFSGAIVFVNNYANLPVTGTIDIIYCLRDSYKIYIWNGGSYVETLQILSQKGAVNGYASLDSLGKVPISQLPSSIMEYKGMWNASTNTPTLANGTGDTGDVYICNVAGSVNFGAGVISFAVGDYVIYSGSIWQRSSGAVGTVTSVALSVPSGLSVSGSPVTTSGTITITGAGNSTQYLDGTGALQTFPTLLSSDNLVKLVRNQSGATMTAGTVIYISGATGNKPLIAKALATGDATSAQTYGLLQSSIANNADGYVVVIGNVSNLDTSALTEGQQLYLSGTTAGTYTTTKPYAPIHLVYIGIVLRSHPTMGIIGVKIQNGYEMDELHNVDAYLPNNNDILSYNTTTSLWEHKQIATTLGYTPISGTGTSGQVAYFNGTSSITSNAAFAFTPTTQLLVNNSVTAASAIARGTNLTPTLTAAANSDVLVGLDINPTFTNGSFTGVGNIPLRINLSQNASTLFVINNTTSGTASESAIQLLSNSGNLFQLGKASATKTAYKTISGGDGYIYNSLSGNLSILNDFAGGNINLAANGSSTPQWTLNSNGTVTQTGNFSQNGLTLSFNQNASTIFTVSNTTAGTFSQATMYFTSDASSGTGQIFKYSTLRNAYKNIGASALGFYNATAGNISILNDFASGNINFAAGGASTAQATLFSTGNFAVGSTTDNGTDKLQVTGSAKITLPVNNYFKIFTTGSLFSTYLGTSSIANQYAWWTNLTYNGTAFVKDYIAFSGWRTNNVVSNLEANSSFNIDYSPAGTVNVNTRFTIFGSGNINIGGGSDNGTDKLQVTGSAKVSTTLNVGGNAIVGTESAIFTTNNAGGNAFIRVYNSGVSTVGGASGIVLTNSIAGNASSQIIAEGVDASGNTNIKFLTSSAYSGIERLRIFQSGNVLIQNGGTFTDAGYKLDVNGTGRFSGALTVQSNTTGATQIASFNNYINNDANYSYIAIANTASSVIGVTRLITGNVDATNPYFEIQNRNNANSFIANFRIWQSGNVHIQNGGTYTDIASSILTMTSTTKGFLPPRMTTTQRDAISSPATGLQVYNTTTNTNDFYNGTAWTSQSATTTASGTYAPTITANTNVTSASNSGNAIYSRVGNVVTVSGFCNVQNTASGVAIVTISLPIASSLSNGSGDANGTGAFFDVAAHSVAQVYAGSSVVYLGFTTVYTGGSKGISYQFTYLIN
jgi:hypothetical protein